MTLLLYLKRKNLFSFFVFLFVFTPLAPAQHADFDPKYHPAAMLIRNARFLLQEEIQTPDHFFAAIGLLERAASFEPKNKEILRMLSFLYKETGNHAAQTKVRSRLVKLAPGDQVASLDHQRDLLNTRNQSSSDRMSQYKIWKGKIEKYFEKPKGGGGISGSEIFSRLMFDAARLARQRGDLQLWNDFIETATRLDPYWEELAAINMGKSFLKEKDEDELQTISDALDEATLSSRLLLSNPSNPDHAMLLADVYLKHQAYYPASRWLEMAVSGMAMDSQVQARGELLIENLVNIDDSAIEKLALARWASGQPGKALDGLHERQEVVNALHKDEFKSFYEEKYGVSPLIGDRTKWRYPIEHTLSRLRALIDPDWPTIRPTRDPFLRGLKSLEHVVLSYKEYLKKISVELEQEELNFKVVLNKDPDDVEKSIFEKRIEDVRSQYQAEKIEAAFWVLFLGWRDHISPDASKSTQEKLKTIVRDILSYARGWIDETKEDMSIRDSEVQDLLELMYQWREVQYCVDLSSGQRLPLNDSECSETREDMLRQLEKIYQETLSFRLKQSKDSLLYRTSLAVQARMLLDRAEIHPSVGKVFSGNIEKIGSELRLLKAICFEFRKKQEGMHHLCVWARRKLAVILGKENYDLDKKQQEIVNELEVFDKLLPENLESFFGMPDRFIEVKFTPQGANSNYYAPVSCDITIKNLCPFPLTVSPQGPVNPVFLLKVSIIPNDLTGVIRKYEEEIPIYFSDRLRLDPGELYTKTIDIRQYPMPAKMFNLNELVTYIDGQFRMNFKLQDSVDSDNFNVTAGRFGIEKSIPHMLVYGLNIRRETDNAVQILDKIKNRIQMNMPINVSDVAVLSHAQNLTEQAFLDTKRYNVDQKTFLPQLQKKAREEFQDFIASSMNVLKESYQYLKSRNEDAARAWLIDVMADGSGLDRMVAEDSSELVQMAYLMRLILRSGDGLVGHTSISPRQAEGASGGMRSLYKIYRDYYQE